MFENIKNLIISPKKIIFFIIILIMVGIFAAIIINKEPSDLGGIAIEKVKDPEKMVKDEEVIKELRRQGINPDYVELFEDYDAKDSEGKAKHVYSRVYKDRKSNKYVAEFSSLPMARAFDGKKIEVGWEFKDGIYYAKPNLFDAIVSGTEISVTALNDQPDGKQKGDKTEWDPVLKLDGLEVTAISGPTLLDVDPVNPNYSNNVIEYDYGVVKRRVRLIEGQLLERWVFEENPGATVRIEHNFIGPKLKLGQYAVDSDTEQVTKEQFAQAEYPFEISATGTFYPDGSPESATVDGVLSYYEGYNVSWSSVVNSAGRFADDSRYYKDAGGGMYSDFVSGEWSGTWWGISRSVFLFDTSSITSSNSVISATLSLTFGYVLSDFGYLQGALGIVSSTPASNTALVASDYSRLGSESLSNIINYSALSDGTTYNDFVLNDTGESAINVSGISKFGVRSEFDRTNNAPTTWGFRKTQTGAVNYSEKGVGYKPKLVVVYIASCGAGQYLSGESCIDVGAGWWSPANNSSRYQCSAGYYGSSATNSVATCNGACTAGYYCTAGSTSATQNACGGNQYYCPAASVSQTSVSSGYYSTGGTETTRTGQSQCIAGTYCSAGVQASCPAGTYGSTAGLTTSACSGNCSAGYYCSAGSTSATQNLCGADNYCPVASGSETSCPVNSSTNGATGQDEEIDCVCDEDYFDPDGDSNGRSCGVDINQKSCLSFDGENDYISANFDTSELLNNFTLSTWFKTEGGDQGELITTTNDRIRLQVMSDNQFYFGMKDSLGNRLDRLAGTIMPNEWHHYVVTWNAPNYIMYVNGVSIYNDSWGYIPTNTDTIFIGGQTYDFNGLIDDVRVYNRALSTSEVKQLYNSRVYSRSFTVDNVSRDSCGVGSISTEATSTCSTGPGTSGVADDPSTQKITINVNWSGGGSAGSAMSKVQYLTRAASSIFKQTNWIGGADQEGPITSINNQFSSSTDINYSGTTGSIIIEGY